MPVGLHQHCVPFSTAAVPKNSASAQALAQDANVRSSAIRLRCGSVRGRLLAAERGKKSKQAGKQAKKNKKKN